MIEEQKGFTLIELLVVIGILGILAAAILVALNPLEKFASGRDAGRLTALNQIGHSLQSYFTTKTQYPPQGTNALSTLQTSGELKTLPSNPAGASGYAIGCNTANTLQTNGAQSIGICYLTNITYTEAIVYVRTESTAGFVKAACTAGQIGWVV